MENYEAFSAFLKEIRTRSRTLLTSAFSARVVYAWNNQHVVERLEGFAVANYNSTIELKEGSLITADKFHPSFNPDYQRMLLDPIARTLTIEGDSPKMSGSYTVTIYYDEP